MCVRISVRAYCFFPPNIGSKNYCGRHLMVESLSLVGSTAVLYHATGESREQSNVAVAFTRERPSGDTEDADSVRDSLGWSVLVLARSLSSLFPCLEVVLVTCVVCRKTLFETPHDVVHLLCSDRKHAIACQKLLLLSHGATMAHGTCGCPSLLCSPKCSLN